MKKTYTPLLSVLFLGAILLWIYLSLMPRWLSDDAVPLSDFSTKRALEHVEVLSKEVHYTGSAGHENVSSYIESELKKLGLEVYIQEGTSFSDWGNLVKAKNIMARIKGSANTKALLLLSHYDSAPHSYSFGAADDASGVATILEGLRAFAYSKTPHKNDIIVLFTDAEELGLNGAALFVTQHKWASEIGVAVNFEARGTAGPGYMLMETNNGNSAMVDAFAAASPKYPVSNSLMYSIYKMLPNDTDLTVFREQGKIQGYNFAFIDNHFNYHTSQDDYAHLSPETLSHQGTYLMPLLHYFADADLKNLNSNDDQVYFNTPVGFIHYPFSWTFPLVATAVVLFLFLVFVGMGKRILVPSEMGKGFLLFFGALLTTVAIAFFGWKIILEFYPQYNDILQGFPYNGHDYIAAFILLSIAVSFLFYWTANNEGKVLNYTVAPLLIWLLISLAAAVFLPGAGFLIIPVLFTLLMFGWFVVSQSSGKALNLLLSVPALFIVAPFIVMFPIGLGMKILAATAALTFLLFSLLLPVFGMFGKKGLWSAACFIAAIAFLIHAHLNSDYKPGSAKPNSLVYFYDSDKEAAIWASYDLSLDDWTQNYLTDKPADGRSLEQYPLYSKYGTKFNFTTEALVRDLPAPQVEFLRDSTGGTQRYVKIRITPNRKVNRYDIFADEKMQLHNLVGNGAKPLGQKGSLYLRKGKKILSYYVVNNEPLILEFSIPVFSKFDMTLLESSFDLMSNPAFRMTPRPKNKIPMPFELNDAVILKKSIKPSPRTVVTVPIPVRKTVTLAPVVNDTIQDPDAEN